MTPDDTRARNWVSRIRSIAFVAVRATWSRAGARSILCVVAASSLAFATNRYFGVKTLRPAAEYSAAISPGDLGVSEAVRSEMNALSDDDSVLGAPDAPVTIVEFGDYSCEHCASFESDTLPEIAEKFIRTGVVRFVFRDLPLPFHPRATIAAEASECAHKQDRFWDFHHRLLEEGRTFELSTLQHLASDLKLDLNSFSSCISSGMYHLEVQEDAEAAAQYSIAGTPGFVVNGLVLSGAIDAATLTQVICGLVPLAAPCLTEHKPELFNVTIIEDVTCNRCDTASTRAHTSELFPGARYRAVEASSAEGLQLIEAYSLNYAPAFIFPREVTQTSAWRKDPQTARSFTVLRDGNLRLLDSAIGASWHLKPEVRAAQLASVRSALGVAAGNIQVDLFLMSLCPYGADARASMRPVLKALDGFLIFKPHYVVTQEGPNCLLDGSGTKYCSKHGAQELDQDIRELCVLERSGLESWFDFSDALNELCPADEVDECWPDAAFQSGLEPSEIEVCQQSRAVDLARRELATSSKVEAAISPTVFINGIVFEGRVSTERLITAICDQLPDSTRPSACDPNIAEMARVLKEDTRNVGRRGRQRNLSPASIVTLARERTGPHTEGGTAPLASVCRRLDN